MKKKDERLKYSSCRIIIIVNKIREYDNDITNNGVVKKCWKTWVLNLNMLLQLLKCQKIYLNYILVSWWAFLTCMGKGWI